MPAQHADAHFGSPRNHVGIFWTDPPPATRTLRARPLGPVTIHQPKHFTLALRSQFSCPKSGARCFHTAVHWSSESHTDIVVMFKPLQHASSTPSVSCSPTSNMLVVKLPPRFSPQVRGFWLTPQLKVHWVRR